jgi:hypothetical protein
MCPGPVLQIWAREAPSGPDASAARGRHAQSPARPGLPMAAKAVRGGIDRPIKRISTAEGRLLPLDATGTRRNPSGVQAGAAALLGAASGQAEATRGRGTLGRACQWAGRPDSASRKLTS